MGTFKKIASFHTGEVAEISLGIHRASSGAHAPCFVVSPHPGLLVGEGVAEAIRGDVAFALDLRHGNLVTACEAADSFVSVEPPAIAYEHFEGLTLDELLSISLTSKMQLSRPMALRIGLDLARALRHVLLKRREAGLVTKDCEGVGMLTPDFVHVSTEGDVRILGTALGPAFSAIARAFPDSVFNSKRRYVAPEVLQGSGSTAAADVFSLGVIVWEAIVQKRFNFTPLAANIADVPAHLAKLIDGAVAREPTDRTTTVETLEAELGAHLHGAYPRFAPRHLGIYVKGLSAKRLKAERRQIAAAIANAHILMPSPAAKTVGNQPGDHVTRGRDLELSKTEATAAPRLRAEPGKRGAVPWNAIVPSKTPDQLAALVERSAKAHALDRMGGVRPQMNSSRAWLFVAMALLAAAAVLLARGHVLERLSALLK